MIYHNPSTKKAFFVGTLAVLILILGSFFITSEISSNSFGTIARAADPTNLRVCSGEYSYMTTERYCDKYYEKICDPAYLPEDCIPILGPLVGTCRTRTVEAGGTCADSCWIAGGVTTGQQCNPDNANEEGYIAGDDECATPIKSLTTCVMVSSNMCEDSYTNYPGEPTVQPSWRICPGGGTGGTGGTTQTCEEYSSYPTLNRYPQYNPNRTAVTELQNSLMYLGYPLPEDGADGYYGSETASAISSFKSTNGLSGGGDVFETSAWQVLENKVNEKVESDEGVSCGGPEEPTTTYTLEMRAKVRHLDGTVEGLFESSGTGISLNTCLGSGTTTFRKTASTIQNGCAISAPNSITFNGKEYTFDYWLKNGINTSDNPDSSIDLDNAILTESAIAHYQEPGCGNWIVESGETCDDGNLTSGDGCSATCQIERTPICPNGIVESPETCDDGNTTNGDGCSSTCQTESSPPICGDGEVNQPSEDCDGTTNCQEDCTIAECVDGSDNDGDLATDGSDLQCDEDCALTDTCGGGNGGCTGDGCGPCVGLGCDDSEDEETPVVWITATPKVVARGGTTLLDWGTDSTGAVTCTSNSDPDDTEWADDAIITQEGPGEGINITLDITGITTFSITCINSELEPGSASVDVVVLTIKEVRP